MNCSRNKLAETIPSELQSVEYVPCMIASLVLLLALALPSPALSADWPNWRNDASNSGQSGESILLPLVPKWHSSAPFVEENGAVVAGAIAYMQTRDGHLYAFDVLTGFILPGYPVTCPGAVDGSSFGTPAVDQANGLVYVVATGKLYAFRLNGTSAWTKALGTTGFNYNEGPVLDGGYVYVKGGGNLQKYDAAGNLQWSASAGVNNNTQPAIMGDFVYANTEAGQIRKFNKATGVEVSGGGTGFPIATVASQSALTTVDGKIFHKADQLYAYNAATGSLLWSRPSGGNATYYGSPAVSGGAVYVYGFTDAKLYAFDENTGAALAGFPTVSLDTRTTRNWCSPTVAGGKIFIGAGQSQVMKVVGAAGTAQAGTVLDQYQTFSTDTQGFDLCSMVVSDGWVFAMLDGGGLYAFYGGQGNPPTGALTINGGAGCTTSRDVVLTFDNNNNPAVTQMRISEDPLFAGALWQAYARVSNWTLSSGFGTKTVYGQLKDTNALLSVVFTAQIDYLATCSTNVSLDIYKFNYFTGTEVAVGDPITYEVSFDNYSNIVAAVSVSLVDTLPAEVDFVSMTTNGAVSATYDAGTRTITWDFGTWPPLSAGPTNYVTVRVNSLASQVTNIVNQASVVCRNLPPITTTDTNPRCRTNCTPGVPTVSAPVLTVTPAANRGYYQLTATSGQYSPSQLHVYVADSASTFVAGPYPSGTVVKIKRSPTTGIGPASGPASVTINVRGDGQAYAVDPAARSSSVVTCRSL